MKMIVCIKQVPSSNEVKLDPITKTILRDGRQSVINPFDTYALEEAVRIKEKLGGSICALSMGIPAVERILRDAIACGADEGVLLSDRAFAGADTLATSYALSLGVHKIGEYRLILCGKMAIDGDTAQIGPELAQQLQIPHIVDVTEIIEIDERHIVCRKATDCGSQMVEMELPGLITVAKDINMPRLASIKGVRKSLSAPLSVYTAQQVGGDVGRLGLQGSPTQVVKTYTPQKTRECVFWPGETKEQTQKMISLLKKEKLLAEERA
ncbi:electron transfer flavoprotein subunit beta/FixA family protein [Acidaminobacterium chupaoyuni]